MGETQQTNPTDIELAIKRLKEWKNGRGNGIFEEVLARALKQALAEQLDEAMQSGERGWQNGRNSAKTRHQAYPYRCSIKKAAQPLQYLRGQLLNQ